MFEKNVELPQILKFNIQKTKIMASGPIISWESRWGKSGNSGQFYFGGGFKITMDSDCCHEIKRCLLLGRKAVKNKDSAFKSRDITWTTKVRLVKAMAFAVVMYGCESWTIQKAEC